MHFRPAVPAWPGNVIQCFAEVLEAGATGLEPATSGVTGRRSNQLNYAPRRRAVYPRAEQVGMTRLDWIIVAFAAFTAFRGYRRGLVRTVLSFVGLAAGAVIGARAAPHFFAPTTTSHYGALIGLGAALAGAMLFRFAAVLAGGLFRQSLRLAPPLRMLDSLGGLAVGVASGLA